MDEVELLQLVTMLETLVAIPKVAKFIHILPIRLKPMAIALRMRDHAMWSSTLEITLTKEAIKTVT